MSCARSAESSFSAMPSPASRSRSAGVTSTIPTRDFASPLSFSRIGVSVRTSAGVYRWTPRSRPRAVKTIEINYVGSASYFRQTNSMRPA